MTTKSYEAKLERVKKLAAKGQVGLYFATLWLACIIIRKKVWEYIGSKCLRLGTCILLACAFISNTSFVPLSIEKADYNYNEEAYSMLSIEEELDVDEYTKIEVTEQDETASLDDIVVLDADKNVAIDENVSNGSEVKSFEDSMENSENDLGRFDKNSWNLLLVNKQHPIPDDYSFTLGTIKGSMKCDERILAPLREMFEAAAIDGVNLVVCSPYRDMSRQEYLFDRKMKVYINSGLSYLDAYKEASSVVTVPGASEHQIGLSLDIICDTYSTLNDGFGETAAGIWLRDNSYKYGFILRYPLEKEDITGIIYEPWHFRYVGSDAATYMYENNLTLEEFIESL